VFADIKGSTELMADLDPEQARTIIDPALKLMIDAVHRYDGYIVQSTGDGIFALFGAPIAHEDHPQRAIYAALRMQEELKRHSAKVVADGGMPVEARIGANTGEVVVRSIRTGDKHVEYTPIGHTSNLASRMQAVAPTGSIAVSQATRKLVEGYFQLKARGPTPVKGLSEPVNVYEITGLGPLRTRLQVSAQRGLTKFVGRQAELEQMKHALEQARAGHGQIVAAMAEPGVGKSRLFFEFKAVSQSGLTVLEAFSISHGRASAYLPVLELLKGYFKITPDDDDRARREKVTGKVLALDRSLEDTLPYLLVLLDIQPDGDDSMAQLDPQLKRRRTLEAIKRVLVRESLSQPLIIVFEDLHWIDNETQALLNLLVDSLATAQILLLVNYRPEYHHQWGNRSYYSQLRLDPLGRESSNEMLAVLLGDSGELTPLKGLIIERTEGNPFFIEEMVQALFEQGVLARNGAVTLSKQLGEIRAPATVEGLLASRIDRLPSSEKELLQTLAVLGREFPLALIKRVTGKPDTELEQMLSELQLGEFIYEQPATADIEYQFKHALTQEVAYNSVLTERRRSLHERTAQAIEALFADRLEDHVAELAHHYERSGSVGKAVEYLGRAGHQAAQRTAFSEAIGYFTRTVELLKQTPEGVDRDRREVDLQMALGWSLYVGRGPQAPQRESVLLRAQELSERLGDSSKLMEVLLAVALFRFNQRELGLARELGERVLVLAQNANAPAIMQGAQVVVGASLYFAAEFEAARGHFELAPEFPEIAKYTLSSGAEMLAGILCLQGYPSQALEKNRKALASARQHRNPVPLCNALLSSGILHFELRDNSAVTKYAGELLSIATEHELPYYQPVANVLLGWAEAASGLVEEGILRMGKSVSASTGVPPRIFASLAEVSCKSGNLERGLSVVKEGLAIAERTGQLMGQSELYRVQGELELLRQPSGEATAERCFRTAIEIALRQKARFWELRATTSLARLLKRQGKTEEARQLLSDIYKWFTEGFDSADLKDAKALLDELCA
jgi:class 3 adenylate cyclase